MSAPAVPFTLAVLLALGSCSGAADPPAPAETGTVEALRAAVAELEARPELDVKHTRVSHVLIAFQGARDSVSGRSRDEAERLAAEVFRRAAAGADFAELVAEHSDDPGAGTYSMTSGTRSQMVRGFGDVAWRLAVGEVGVAAYDPHRTPHGWHVIKRIE